MKKYVWALCCSAVTWAVGAQSPGFDERAKAYVKQYGAWAIEEQQRVGIPASITLAQGIYETGAGESELATKANNHFGIKCKKDWKGETFAHTDDAPNECFRKYKSAKDSYKDHSDYLKSSVRYAELFTYDRADYVSWAKGLKKCGYATNPAYAQRLIKMVEDYDLQSYTFAADGKRNNEIVPEEEQAPLVVKTDPLEGAEQMNGLRGVYSLKGENLLDKAMKYNIRYARLLEINELPDEPLKKDMFIYLEPKRNKGAHATHTVLEGETIESIAHSEGMNTRQLRIFNLLAINEQPVPGAVLKLQEQSDERPQAYRMVKADALPATPAVQTVRLASPSAVPKDEYLPTKRSVQKVEEIEFGYGAEPPAALKAMQAKEQQDAKLQQQTVTPSQRSAPSANSNESVKSAQVAAQPMPASLDATATGRPKLESEIAAETDAGDLPRTLEPEQPVSAVPQPNDELAMLKAKLDQSVYARTSRSNVRVSSDDSAAVFNQKGAPERIASKQAAPAPEDLSAAVYHTVQKGDTGYSIARKYGIKVAQLNEWNNLNFEGIKVGQKLRVK